MGLFQQVVKALFKNNYALIAENTTKYYLELTRNYSNRFDDEVALLTTAGVLDAQVYVFAEGSIKVDAILSIARGVLSEGKMSEESLDFYYYRLMAWEEWRKGKTSKDLILGKDNTELDDDPLFGFIFSLEVELFKVDTPHSPPSLIASACYSKANTIFKAIQKTKERYNSEATFTLATANLMDSPKFEAIRKQLGIKK